EAAEALNEAEADAEFDLLALYLDPGLAFGTGKHPTTELCLQFLDDLKPNGMRIVDAGAGSGILSLGALLLGARSVFAFDIDGNALTAMRQNLRMNCPPLVEGQLSAHHGGFDLPELERELEHADLLLGNITAGVILQNQNVIMSGSHRRMALSGILSEQSDRVVEAFQPAWRLNRMLTNDGWVLLDMERVS
ncbi:MAG: 50S ribosomal protein L11 methyltransferase, partial [Leptospiraceae bacterium]|nr:50S ribosomal protein L11 methyltransferase [Leptospiraceae bacterium]